MYIPTMFPRNYFHILTALDALELCQFIISQEHQQPRSQHLISISKRKDSTNTYFNGLFMHCSMYSYGVHLKMA